MSDLPENRRMMVLSRKYSDCLITRKEFCEQRRKLLDDIDASYNRKHSVAADMANGIKMKFEDVMHYLKNRIS